MRFAKMSVSLKAEKGTSRGVGLKAPSQSIFLVVYLFSLLTAFEDGQT